MLLYMLKLRYTTTMQQKAYKLCESKQFSKANYQMGKVWTSLTSTWANWREQIDVFWANWQAIIWSLPTVVRIRCPSSRAVTHLSSFYRLFKIKSVFMLEMGITSPEVMKMQIMFCNLRNRANEVDRIMIISQLWLTVNTIIFYPHFWVCITWTIKIKSTDKMQERS